MNIIVFDSGIEQPEDKGILLKDIIEDTAFINNNGNIKIQEEKSNCIDANYHKGIDNHGQRTMVIMSQNKKPIIIPEKTEIPFMLTECRTEHGKETRKKIRQETGKDSTKRDKESKVYVPNNNGKANCIMTGNGDMLSSVFIKDDGKANCISAVGKDSIVVSKERKSEKCEQRRIKNRKELNDKGNCLQASTWKGEAANGCTIINDDITWRKLTPIECERLQTVPDNYTNHVSNSQRYKMLGNGWTVDVISWIFSFLPS